MASRLCPEMVGGGKKRGGLSGESRDRVASIAEP